MAGQPPRNDAQPASGLFGGPPVQPQTGFGAGFGGPQFGAQPEAKIGQGEQKPGAFGVIGGGAMPGFDAGKTGTGFGQPSATFNPSPAPNPFSGAAPATGAFNPSQPSAALPTQANPFGSQPSAAPAQTNPFQPAPTFGGAAPSPASQPQNTGLAPTGPGAFAASGAQQAAGGGLFGPKPGQSASAPSPFGAAPSTFSPMPPASNPQAGSGLFGAAPTASSGLFGAPKEGAAPSQPKEGAANPFSAPKAGSAGLFGPPKEGAAPANLFAAPKEGVAASPALFGQPKEGAAPSQPAQPAGGLFAPKEGASSAFAPTASTASTAPAQPASSGLFAPIGKPGPVDLAKPGTAPGSIFTHSPAPATAPDGKPGPASKPGAQLLEESKNKIQSRKRIQDVVTEWKQTIDTQYQSFQQLGHKTVEVEKQSYESHKELLMLNEVVTKLVNTGNQLNENLDLIINEQNELNSGLMAIEQDLDRELERAGISTLYLNQQYQDERENVYVKANLVKRNIDEIESSFNVMLQSLNEGHEEELRGVEGDVERSLDVYLDALNWIEGNVYSLDARLNALEREYQETTQQTYR